MRSLHRAQSTEFAWDRNSFSRVDTVGVEPCLIGKDMVRALVSEIAKKAGEVGVDMITDLVNQIIVEGVIPVEWKLSTIVNCCYRKGDGLERENRKDS